MANTTIKITQLPSIGNNLTAGTVLPVVAVNGITPVTDKTTIGNIANFVLTNAGNTLPPALLAIYSQTVTNAAQPNITSVGTLTSVTVTGNIGGNLKIPSIANLKISGGTNGYVIQTDGTGNLTWTAQTGGSGNGTVGGANTEVQYNDAGFFGGNAGFTFDKVHGVLSSPLIDTPALFNLAGTVIENADLSHGATSALVIPANGNTTNPAQLNNFYGNVLIQAGTDADHIKSWNFDNAGNLALPGVLLAQASDNGSIVFSNNGTDNNGSLKVDGGYNMVISADSNFYVKRAGSDRLAITDTNTDLMASSNVVIHANKAGTENNWTFDTTGNLTLPGYVNLPLTAKLNSGGIDVTNAAEFGTEVTTSGDAVTGSQIYMGAGTAESRAIVNGDGNSLMYLGVENPGFAGMVSMDPGVTSEYAIQVGSNNEIQIGAVIGPITTTEYVAGLGVLNDTGNINGIFANANVAVIGVGDLGWKFDNIGNLTLPSNTSSINYANGDPYGGGGAANTGNVTFSDFVVQGRPGYGLALAPTPDDTANLKYLQVRAGDVDSHIHFDTGNNNAYDQYFGDDNKYLKLANTGNVTISAYQDGGPNAQWTFSYDGNLTLANGNSVIQSIANSSLDPANPNVSTMVLTPDQSYSSQSLVLDPTAPGHIHLRAPSANIDEPVANIFLGGEDSSFEVGYYNGSAPNVFIHSGGNTWTFGNDGNLTTPGVAGNITGANIISANTFITPNISINNAPGTILGSANVVIDISATGNSGGVQLDYIKEQGNANTSLGEVSLNAQGPGSSSVFTVSLTGDAGNGSTNRSWVFSQDGSFSPPVQPSNQRTGSGLTLQIGDVNSQAIITGPTPVPGVFDAAPRLVVAGQDGVNAGEGGDIYLWAGQSGPSGGSGGDIKVDGGVGLNGSEGGTIKVRGGYSYGATGGFVEVYAGQGETGGVIDILAGTGNTGGGTANIAGGYTTTGSGGNVNIRGGGSSGGIGSYGNVNISAGASSWYFDNTGTLILPNSANITNGNLNAGSASASVALNAFSPDGNTVSFQAQGNTSNAVIQAYNNTSTTTQSWTFDNTGNLTTPGNVIVTATHANIVIGDATATGSPGLSSTTSFDIVADKGGSNVAWTFGTSGDLYTPGNIITSGSGGDIIMTGGNIANANVVTANSFIGTQSNVDIVAGSYTWTFDDTSNVTMPGQSSVLTSVNRNGDDAVGSNYKTQMTLGWNGTAEYAQWIRTRHNASANVNNAIDFFTSDGTQNASFPGNAILGGSITQGAMQLAVYTDTTARDNTITTPQVGMMIYVTGVGMQVRGATSWNTILGSGT